MLFQTPCFGRLRVDNIQYNGIHEMFVVDVLSARA